MPESAVLAIDYTQAAAIAKIAPQPLPLSSHQAGWQNIHLVQYQLPPGETPEMINLQHIISLSSWKYRTEVNATFAGKQYRTEHPQHQTGFVEILPAYVPMRSSWNQEVEFMHCYLEPNFLAHVAYESVNPDRVEVQLAIQQPDPLIWQIVHALGSVLKTDADNSRFYAESMAAALAAHILQHYATRKLVLRVHEDGLPQYKLKQALNYINEHFRENLSLAELSAELGISQYYFCRLFKQSTGITPHAYLIQQRVERSKQMLKQKDQSINQITIECGFANPSHFARCFRQHTGISPKQFRKI